MSVPAPVSQGALRLIDARSLFLTAGFDAACGWPLPDGSLPVGGKGLGHDMWMTSPAEWEAYRNLCAAERAANCALNAAA